MNIFYLHPNPRRCARWHCNKHVVKMILESCQLLYTAHWVLMTSVEPDYIHCAPNRGYKPTHPNHPCSIWIRESIHNYRWLVALAKCLCEEYTFRYGKIHSSAEHVVWLSMCEPPCPNVPFTLPRCAMPEIYKHPNPIVAYRRYYCEVKDVLMGIAVYKKRQRPHFLYK
jgi:hypothetical protein